MTFRALTQEEIDSPKEKKPREAFDRKIEEIFVPNLNPDDLPEDDEGPGVPTVERDTFDKDAVDMYLKAEVTLPIGGEMLSGKV